MAINWSAFDSKYVKIDNEWTALTLTNWQQTIKAGPPPTPALAFNVLQENGVTLPIPKVFEASTRDLVQKLKPIIIRAEETNKPTIRVKICRVEKGKYGVEEI